MNKLLLGTFAVALTMGGSAAIAADMPVKAPVYTWSWTGCYGGIEGGGKWARSRQDGFGFGGTTPVFTANNVVVGGVAGNAWTPFYDVTGGLIGGEIGCNMQFGNYWVFGVESDISWSGARGSSNETGPLGVFFRTTAWSDETRQQWLATSRARIGWTWDRAWIYVTGGWASARVQSNVTTTPGVFGAPVAGAAAFAIPGGTFSDVHVLYGWTVGAGFEYAFWNRWSVKGEYLYVRLENLGLQFFGTPLFPQFERGALNVDEHIFRVGLNYRFSDCVFFECAEPTPAIHK
jgi:outer membrane immunogenic protein